MAEGFVEKRGLKEVKNKLLERFPEFQISEERSQVYDDDGAYVYFQYFYYYIEKLVNQQRDGDVVYRMFDFINEVFESKELDKYVWDLFNIELFELFELFLIENLKYFKKTELFQTSILILESFGILACSELLKFLN